MLGYQTWRNLSFLHWPTPAPAVRRILPAELELDLWDGQAWIGVVPFLMCGVRPAWWPQFCGLNFPETNLRTYVTYRGQPGVYFLSLDAASLPAVMAARWGWSLPYYHARMSIREQDGEIRYASQRYRREARLEAAVRLTHELGESKAGSLEHWLVERYHLFVVRRGRLYQGTVQHVPYPVWKADCREPVRESLFEAAGLPPARGQPTHVHFSPGVEVEIVRLSAAEAGALKPAMQVAN